MVFPVLALNDRGKDFKFWRRGGFIMACTSKHAVCKASKRASLIWALRNLGCLLGGHYRRFPQIAGIHCSTRIFLATILAFFFLCLQVETEASKSRPSHLKPIAIISSLKELSLLGEKESGNQGDMQDHRKVKRACPDGPLSTLKLKFGV